MDIFEYFDFFKNNESTNNLADVEEKIIDSLFEKYIPSTGRILVVSSDNIQYAFKLVDQGYKVTVTESSEERINEIKNDKKFPPRLRSLHLRQARQKIFPHTLPYRRRRFRHQRRRLKNALKNRNAKTQDYVDVILRFLYTGRHLEADKWF